MGAEMHAASSWRLLRFTRLLRSFYFTRSTKAVSLVGSFSAAPSTVRHLPDPPLMPKTPVRNHKLPVCGSGAVSNNFSSDSVV